MTTPTSTTSIKCGYGSDTGRKRKHNEDSYAVLMRNDLNRLLDGIILVSDGMGGMGGGDTASRMVAQGIPAEVIHKASSGETDFKAILNEAVLGINQQVFKERDSSPKLHSMGATCVCSLLVGDQMTYCNVGDSRIYLLRAGKLTQLTDDHSHVWEEVKAGRMSREMAQNAPMRNVITRAMGLAETVKPDIDTITLQESDIVMLCSDGLTTEVPESEIQRILASNGSPQIAANTLIQAALTHGGSDNVTVVVMHYGYVPESEFEDTSTEKEIFPGVMDGLKKQGKKGINWGVTLASILFVIAIASAIGVIFQKLREKSPVIPVHSTRPSLPAPPKQIDYNSKPVIVNKGPFSPFVLQSAPNGNLLLASNSGKIEVYTPGGTSLGTLPQGDLFAPKVAIKGQSLPDVVFDKSGDRLQIDCHARAILEINPAGVLVNSTIGLGELRQPTRILAVPAGSLYVLDAGQLLMFTDDTKKEK